MQRELDQYKSDLVVKEAALENLSYIRDKSKYQIDAQESEEKQRGMIDYERKENELILFRSFIETREKKIRALNELSDKISKRDSSVKQMEMKIAQQKRNIRELKMQAKMTDLSRKVEQRDSDLDISSLSSRVGKFDTDEMGTQVSLERFKPSERSEEGSLFFSTQERKPKKTKKKNKKDRRESKSIKKTK